MRICPACGGMLRPWRTGTSVCATCGTAARDHQPGPGALAEHYAAYHESAPDLSPLTGQRLRQWAETLARDRRTGRLLEVGCGAGHFLRAAGEAGFEAWGTEISGPVVQRLRADGLRVEGGDLVDLALPAGHFDAVVLFEVLEHLPSPRAHLEECRRLLRDGGVLFLTTPNFGSLSRRLLGDRWRVIDPEHLVLFTPRGLDRALAAAGFGAVALSTRNIDPVEVLRVVRGGVRFDTGQRQGRVDSLRAEVSARPVLRAAKTVANSLLKALGVGDTLEAWARR